MTRIEKENLQKQINFLQAQLDSFIIGEEEEFRSKGNWFVSSEGLTQKGNGKNLFIVDHFNYFETKEQAEQVAKAQKNFNMICSYILQFDGVLGKGYFNIYKNLETARWVYEYPLTSTLGQHLMSQECAKALCEDLNSGRVVLEEIN